MYTSRYGPYTAVYGRVDGRFRPCRWPVHHRVHSPCTLRHVDVYGAVYVSCTRPCARPVHGRVHVPCMGLCTRHVRGRRRPYRRPVHSHVHGWCRRAVRTANTRPCTGHVYGTAVIWPCTGRFRRRRRVHGPCTRPPCNGHATCYTAVYTAVYTTRYTAVYTVRTRPHNGRLHGRGRDGRVDGRCTRRSLHGRYTDV